MPGEVLLSAFQALKDGAKHAWGVPGLVNRVELCSAWCAGHLSSLSFYKVCQGPIIDPGGSKSSRSATTLVGPLSVVLVDREASGQVGGVSGFDGVI